MIVVDTNIIAGLFLPNTNVTELSELLTYDSEWISVTLWYSEFRSAVSTYVRSGIITYPTALTILEKAESFMSSLTYDVDSAKVMHHVSNSTCSSYDCEFIALAEDINVPLITYDKKLIREFPNIALFPKDYMNL